MVEKDLFVRPEPESALRRLAHEELCIITLEDGAEYEATWSAKIFRFYFKDQSGGRSVSHVDVIAWRPAAVKF